MQDLDQTLLLRSITRYARAVRESALVLSELDEARRACPEIPVFVGFLRLPPAGTGGALLTRWGHDPCLIHVTRALEAYSLHHATRPF